MSDFMKQETSIFYFSMFLLVLLAYFIQVYTFFSPDVGYLLQAAKQMLAGGKYGADIFETNPPLILYLYFPVFLLTKWTMMSLVTAMRVYIIFLALVSLSLCFYLLKNIISSKDKIIFYFLFYTLAVGMLFFPSFDFAQREHILLIFMLPYLLSAALASENKPVHRSMAIGIGILAGFGFALKPFFLVTPCLIELYIMVKQRRLFACIRVESVVLISVLCIYLASIFLLQPDYIHVVLPLVFRYYFPATALSWYQIIVLPNVLFCTAILVSYFIYRQYDRYSSLGWVIELALLGMMMAFLIPKSPWWYHVMPALFLALLLVAHFLGQTISIIKNSTSKLRLVYSSLFLLAGTILVLFFPATYGYAIIKYVYQLQYYQLARKGIVNYINQQSGQHSIACISLNTQACFPLVLYTQSDYADRFPAFWWYPGLRILEKKSRQPLVLTQIRKDKSFLINSFAEDLNRHQARWIIVDTPRFQRIETPSFAIVPYLLENRQFKLAWQHYRYLTTIQSIQLYERRT